MPFFPSSTWGHVCVVVLWLHVIRVAHVSIELSRSLFSMATYSFPMPIFHIPSPRTGVLRSLVLTRCIVRTLSGSLSPISAFCILAGGRFFVSVTTNLGDPPSVTQGLPLSAL